MSSILSLVKDLQKRVVKLEKENKELKRWIGREKQKINITGWLNEHYIPLIDFTPWFKKIKVEGKELELVFTHRIEKGVYYILEKNLPIEERRHFPIIAFKHQRKSIFYVYEKSTWRKIKKNEFGDMIDSITGALFKAFNTWEKEHPEMLEEKNHEIWGKRLQSVLFLPKKIPGILKRLEKRMHSYLALNLKSIIEYEFVF